MNNAWKHEEKNYLCPIFSSDCPLNQKKFLQKIQLGHQRPTKHLKEFGETVRINLTNPGDIIKSTSESKSWNYGNSLLAAVLISLSMLLAFNYNFGIGKCNT